LTLGVAGVVATTATVLGRPGETQAPAAIVPAAAHVEPQPIAPAGEPGVTTDLPEPPGTTERVSVADNEAQANGASGGATTFLPAPKPDQAISADGRWVAFVSQATDLIPGNPLPPGGVYVRDRQDGTTTAIPWVDGRAFRQGFAAFEPTISSDGGVVAFTVIVSLRGTGIAGGSNTTPYVLAWDRLTNATEVVSIDGSGRPVPGWQPSISADGRFVAYTAWAPSNPPVASNPVANPANLSYDPCGPTSTTITVTVTDPENDISTVTLFYSPVGVPTQSVAMSFAGSNTWQATISISGWDSGPIGYSVQATDSQGNSSPAAFPSSGNTLTLHNCIL
jgi:hypothetical protein